MLKVKKTDQSFFTAGLRKFECWAWASDTPMCYTNWLPGEPNDKIVGEDCVLLKGPAKAWGWNDARCDAKYMALCQK